MTKRVCICLREADKHVPSYRTVHNYDLQGPAFVQYSYCAGM